MTTEDFLNTYYNIGYRLSHHTAFSPKQFDELLQDVNTLLQNDIDWNSFKHYKKQLLKYEKLIFKYKQNTVNKLKDKIKYQENIILEAQKKIININKLIEV